MACCIFALSCPDPAPSAAYIAMHGADVEFENDDLEKTIVSMVCNRRRKQKLAQHARPENHSGEASSHHRCQILERVEVAQVGGDHEFRKSTCTMQFIDVPTGGPVGK